MAANRASLQITLAYGRRLKQIERAVKDYIRRTWVLAPGDLDERYEAWKAGAVSVVEQGQLLNIRLTAGYLAAFESSERRRPIRPQPIDPAEYVGKTFGGAQLGDWAESPRIQALTEIKAGKPAKEAAEQAREKASVDAGLHTYTAARNAMSDQLQSNRGIIGYRRKAHGESCGGCLAAANNEVLLPYSSFPTHPGCDCTAEPVLGDVADRYQHPSGLEQYQRMTSTQKVDAVGPEAAQAISEGTISLFDLKGAWQNDFAPDFLTQRPLSDAL